MRAILAVTVMLATSGLPAIAQQERCDCTRAQRSAGCEATVQHRDGVVAVSSSSPACSMVVWTADGQPNVSLVRDGLDIFDWYGASSPGIAVESCEICLDRNLGVGGAGAPLDVETLRPETGIDFGLEGEAPGGQATGRQATGRQATGRQATGAQAAAGPVAAPAVGPAGGDDADASCPGGSPVPELIVPAALDYPAEMERYALDGTCEVLFDIDRSGAAVNIRPTCSHEGFVREAARAVAVVRFTPPYHCGVPVVREDVVYPLVFRYSARERPAPSMAPIPDSPQP